MSGTALATAGSPPRLKPDNKPEYPGSRPSPPTAGIFFFALPPSVGRYLRRMRTNLVPKVITDKNGVTTTRWVKADQKTAVLPAIPLASPVYQPDRTDYLHSVYKAISDHARSLEADGIDIDGATGLIKHFDHTTLRVLADFLYGDEETANYGRLLDAEECISNFREGVHMREVFAYRGAFDDDMDILEISSTVESLHRCTELPAMEDYSEADEQTRSQVIELLQSAVFVSSRALPERRRAVLGKETQEMLTTDDEDDRDRVIEIMGARDTEDPALIRSILNSETPAISNGIL